MRESWQEFQYEFGHYLRDPAQRTLPEGVIPRRAKVYEDLLFNNICGFLNSCFPVCQKLISEDEWLYLSRAFYRDWRCHSPRFNDIAKEFLDFLASENMPELPYPWFFQLAHYEWVELAVDTFDESGVARSVPARHESLSVNPSLHNLIYDWPVHQISPEFLPQQTVQTFLIVYRNSSHEVCFTEINAATSALIQMFQIDEQEAEPGLIKLADHFNLPASDSFMNFGKQMIEELIQQGVLLQY